MSTPVPFSMFVIGAIVFILYLTGYVYMILKVKMEIVKVTQITNRSNKY